MAPSIDEADDTMSDLTSLSGFTETTRPDPGDTQSIYSGANRRKAAIPSSTINRPVTRAKSYSQNKLVFEV